MKVNENRHDNFARLTALLSLAVAIAAIAVPYFQQSQIQKSQSYEELRVILNPNTNGPILLKGSNFGKMGRLIQMPWQLIISNNSLRTTSILETSLSTGSEPGSTYYSGISGGIVDANYDPVEMPLVLEAGVSKSLYIYVGALVPSHVYETLDKINEGNPILDREAMKELGANGIDIYGNRVEYKAFEAGNFIIKYLEPEKSPKFWLRLSTGQGNNFFATASKYGLRSEGTL
ncbi:MAG: hypothetical protein JAZ13_06295 [Candidatus Thiodiazotropha taylori]|nr:hypothetical protein [Candidatus Thiodiazotropha taylori]